ncbi:hypothetical protein [Paracoccus sp. SSK6]|uniref:hypothetical protein n=1 Tax=Paracoccus sp. SSK6 TaxID=3143131 RepID=UPI00321A3B41
MHDANMFDREFDVPVDLTDDTAPGAGAPGPRSDEPTPAEMVGLDGVSAGRLGTAAVLARMSDRQVWAALAAANKVALLALEEGNMPVARRAVAQQEALTRELQRRTELRK